MTLQDAFRVLIAQQAWYKQTGIIRQIAYQDKQTFLRGRLSEVRMRHYLSSAGWVQTQQEEWKMEYPEKSSFLHDSTK